MDAGLKVGIENGGIMRILISEDKFVFVYSVSVRSRMLLGDEVLNYQDGEQLDKWRTINDHTLFHP